MQLSKREVVWTSQEARPRIRRKKTGDGTMHLGEESEEDRSRDGCTVNGDMRAIGTTKDEVQDRTGWRRIVFAAATPRPIGSGLKKKAA